MWNHVCPEDKMLEVISVTQLAFRNEFSPLVESQVKNCCFKQLCLRFS